MKPYGNSAGDSGVRAYEIARESIKVKFLSGETYLYSYKRPGKVHVEKMKSLAEKGKGLSTYISQYVRDNYESKL